MINEMHDLLVEHIDDYTQRSILDDVWVSGIFRMIKGLSTDNRGDLGESYIKSVLEYLRYTVEKSKETDRTKKHWDLKINTGATFEIKTATIGKKGNMFQHESIEKDRNFDILVLLDIAPDAIYLTVAPKKTLPFTEKNKNWTVNPKKMHRRATGIHYKWDLSLKDVSGREIKTLEDAREMFEEALKQKKSKQIKNVLSLK